ncbi:hypothetical protein M0804_013467 [Polistes exclamans]|nr:hypothetical protein M0804_013467 [Polistes exclamans]
MTSNPLLKILINTGESSSVMNPKIAYKLFSERIFPQAVQTRRYESLSGDKGVDKDRSYEQRRERKERNIMPGVSRLPLTITKGYPQPPQ